MLATPLELWELLKRRQNLPPILIPRRDAKRFITSLKQCKYRETRQQASVGIFRYSHLIVRRRFFPGNMVEITVKLIDFDKIGD